MDTGEEELSGQLFCLTAWHLNPLPLFKEFSHLMGTWEAELSFPQEAGNARLVLSGLS